ncbi:MAG TPA: carboxypeptidase-like regulatory domain-containing protein [Mycobacterium sp.]
MVRPPSSPAVRFSTPYRPGGSTATRVVGAVFDVLQTPVPYARVQLRNLSNGVVLGSADTNESGEYTFDVTDPGTYVVEMLEQQNIIALSNAGLLARYQTLKTEIRLPGRWDSNARSVSVPVSATAFFGMSSANSMSSSTLSLAANSNVSPIDPGEPVSPH